METIFITGGLGFIGKHLARAALKSGAKVVVFDNLTAVDSSCSYSFDQGDLVPHIIKGDIRDAALLKEAFQQHRPDVVVHLAAISDAGLAIRLPDECRSVNVEGVNNLLRAIRQNGGVRHFIFVSSSYVYGDFHYEPADERHPLNPQHIYGITKLKGEQITERLCQAERMDYTIVRPTAVYGTGDNLNRVCSRMIVDALTGRKIVVHDGGVQRLDFTHIDDLIRGLSSILKEPGARNQTFNLSRGRTRSIGELAALIAAHIPRTEIVFQPSTGKKPLRGALDISKARERLGFSPHVDIEEGVSLLIDDLRGSLHL